MPVLELLERLDVRGRLGHLARRAPEECQEIRDLLGHLVTKEGKELAEMWAPTGILVQRVRQEIQVPRESGAGRGQPVLMEQLDKKVQKVAEVTLVLLVFLDGEGTQVQEERQELRDNKETPVVLERLDRKEILALVDLLVLMDN